MSICHILKILDVIKSYPRFLNKARKTGGCVVAFRPLVPPAWNYGILPLFQETGNEIVLTLSTRRPGTLSPTLGINSTQIGQ